MSWARAVITGVVIVAVASVLLVYVPDLALTKLTGLGRSGRVMVGSIWFFVALGGIAWTLRRLQAHRDI